jgi:catechol 2,3-dioxygenase-like lactoylglutathione lyase family enzyme
VAFVPSTDLARSREFYEQVLGIPVARADDFAVVLQAAGMTVRVTNVGPDPHVQPFTVLGWEVADVHAEIAELTARGVTFLLVDGVEQDEAGVWAAPGRNSGRLVQGPGWQHAVPYPAGESLADAVTTSS